MTITLRKRYEVEALLTDTVFDLVTDQIGSEDSSTISDYKLEKIKDDVADFLESIIADYLYNGDLDSDLGKSDE